jgi:hypothetical protein
MSSGARPRRPRGNEFSDLDRTLHGPTGEAYDVIADVGYARHGWGILWGKGKSENIPVITVWAGAKVIHQESAISRKDAERIIAALSERISAGGFESA